MAANAIPRRQQGHYMRTFFPGLWLLGVLLLFTSRTVSADDCLLLNGVGPSGGECVVSTARTLMGTFNLDTTVRITGAGSITVSKYWANYTFPIWLSGATAGLSSSAV